MLEGGQGGQVVGRLKRGFEEVGTYKDEVVEGEAKGGEVGEASGEIVLGQVVLH